MHHKRECLRSELAESVSLSSGYLSSENLLTSWLNVSEGGKRSGPAGALVTRKNRRLLASFSSHPALFSCRRTTMGQPRHSYEKCIACGRPFLAYRSRLLASPGRYCSQRCFWQTWKAFRRAQAAGQLEKILALPVCQEVDKDAPATRRRLEGS
jgi:hypothetical protein